VVASGKAALEPLIGFRGWSDRRAAAVLGVAAAVEVAIAGALFAAPAAGWAAAAALITLYLTQLRHMRPGQDCNCFGDVGAANRATAQRRNVVLALISAGLAAAYASGALDPAEADSESTLAVAAVAVGGVLGHMTLGRVRIGRTGPPERSAGSA
jgi:hypothetical protein